MSFLGELFGAIMAERVTTALDKSVSQPATSRPSSDLSDLMKMLQQLSNDDDVDLCKDAPGYDDFVKASDAEYEKRNFSKAKTLYEKACKQGHPMALCNYALWHLEGSRPGVQKNLKLAFKLFSQSADSQSTGKKIGLALYNLAHFYYTGKGGVVKKSHERAFELVHEAIKDERIIKMRQGDPFFLIGQMYLKGHGCMKNVRKAKKYFAQASEFHHPGATGELLKLVDMLSQLCPVERQRETDRRWDRMTAYLDAHPDEKPNTMGGHLAMLNKFGFNVVNGPSEREKRIKGDFSKFMEVTGGQMQMMEDYEMVDEPVPPKKCDHCDKPGAKRRCSRCGEGYCNRACQKAAWQSHKKICQLVQAAQS